jgi:NAD-dependent SIR2 family protein deacetylase
VSLYRTMYCIRCGYDIHGWQLRDTRTDERSCPECGRAFDPCDPDTFARHPRRSWWVQWRWPLIILFGPPVACLVAWGVMELAATIE